MIGQNDNGAAPRGIFLKVVALNGAAQIINTCHVVRVAQEGPGWEVFFSDSQRVQLADSEAQLLFRHLPGLPMSHAAC
jgi:hypothetical protein